MLFSDIRIQISLSLLLSQGGFLCTRPSLPLHYASLRRGPRFGRRSSAAVVTRSRSKSSPITLPCPSRRCGRPGVFEINSMVGIIEMKVGPRFEMLSLKTKDVEACTKQTNDVCSIERKGGLTSSKDHSSTKATCRSPKSSRAQPCTVSSKDGQRTASD